MSFMPIQLPPGLERNGTPYDTPRRFWDMNLMRWVSGSARPIGGWVRKTAAPLDEPVRRFHAWRNNDDTLGTMAATETKLYLDFGGAGSTSRRPASCRRSSPCGGYGSGPVRLRDLWHATPGRCIASIFAPTYALWSFANWGEDVLLLSTEDNRLFHYIRRNT